MSRSPRLLRHRIREIGDPGNLVAPREPGPSGAPGPFHCSARLIRVKGTFALCPDPPPEERPRTAPPGRG